MPVIFGNNFQKAHDMGVGDSSFKSDKSWTEFREALI